jgi:hypothetical protein
MLDLSTPKAPFDIALPYGLLVTLKPLTTAGMAAAQGAGPACGRGNRAAGPGAHGSGIGPGRAA